MSHFYGRLQGSRGEATRCGTKNSGLVVTAASWNGAIKVTLVHEDGVDSYLVEQVPWENTGEYQLIAAGKLNG